MKTFKLKTRSVESVANRIKAFSFVREDGNTVSGITPGGHIILHLPNGTSRRYSLTNGPSEKDAFHIAVLREENSRGASRYMHRMVEAGTVLHASGPFNHLPVNPEAEKSLLIAGGIGITPIISIARDMHERRQAFEMHYCARTVGEAAFADWLKESSFSSHVRFHFSNDRQSSRLDIDALLSSQTEQTHIYYCGPERMMDAIGKAVSGWDSTRVHSESFAGSSIDTGEKKPFEIVIASTGRVLPVPTSKTALDVLWEYGYPVDYVCKEGICGSCMVDVLHGQPDHRDDFQTSEEKQTNSMMATCCSRANSAQIILDL